MMIEKDIDLDIEGMGIVMYSPGNVKEIPVGYDFLMNEYNDPRMVAHHIKKGDIIGFCTGSGGNYTLKIREGYPSAEIDNENPVSIRLGIEVKDEKICFIDLFWLMDWSNECPSEQSIDIENGFYHVTVLTHMPESGIWGDDQEIYIYLNPLDKMPELTWDGVPQLFND